jgi:hypothetical protein
LESARGGRLESSWRAQNELNGRGNIGGRFKPRFNGNNSDGEVPENMRGRFKPKFNGNTSAGEAPGNIRGRFKPRFNGNGKRQRILEEDLNRNSMVIPVTGKRQGDA